MESRTNYKILPGYANRWRAMWFIGLSLLVISLDNTILNVALPSISRDLQASSSDLQWIVDAYVLIFAALLLTMGSLGDRLGRKRALQFGLVMFGIGSLWAALASSTESLIAARAFLGIGGATIMPSTLSIISATFPRDERPQAIAIWAAIFGLGVGIGPLIGGWLLEHFDWNAVFLINLPVILVALAGGQLFISESKDETAPRADIPGVILSIIGLFALVYGIIEAGEAGWTHDTVLFSFGAAVAFLGTFAWWESYTDEPMLPMHFFKNMSFTGANTALALVTFSLFGSLFFMSQYWQSVLGFSAFQTGIRLFPMALTLMIMSANSARVAARLGTKYTVAIGIAIAGLGLLLLSQVADVDTSYGTILAILIVFATGMGLTMSPATNSIMQSIPVSKAGIGSAMNDTTRQLGGALGVAVLGTIMNNTYLKDIGDLTGRLNRIPAEAIAAIESSIQGANRVAASPQMSADTSVMIRSAAAHAFVDGMTDAMLVGAMIMFATALLTLLILPAQVRTSPLEEHEIASSEDLKKYLGSASD